MTGTAQPVRSAARPPVRPAARPAARPRPARSTGRTVLAVAAVVAVVAVGAFAGSRLTGSRTPAPTRTSAAPAPARTLGVTVTSLDLSGGSGLARRGDEWRTQTYRTAAFGGLKPGVGLVLDLGAPHRVTSVTVDALTPGSTLGLRAADSAPTSAAGLTAVGADVTASGPTTFDATSGGAHRYWVVWVSRLGARGDGYGVSLGTPVVTGS